MRLATLRALSLVVGVLSLASSGAARATYQRLARTTSDVCADVDAELQVDLLGINVDVGLLDICLCLSGIPALLTSNIIVETAVGLVGQGGVTNALTDMVNSAEDHQTCHYPDNCDPICERGSPCSFQCKNGFVPSPSPPLPPKDCICPPPNIVCNGICGLFKVCPSSGPKKREDLDRRAVCGSDLTACGVYGWQGFSGAQAWECVDTKNDLESCGGCMIPFGRNPARGVDCTAIPGVMDVACVSGSCIVRRCQPGYTVSLDGSYCLQTEALTRIQAGDLPASLFGLEHVPLQKKSA